MKVRRTLDGGNDLSYDGRGDTDGRTDGRTTSDECKTNDAPYNGGVSH